MMKVSRISVSATYQRGAVLIVGLVMVLLITIVGLAAIRGSNMQELMVGNLRDSHVAFQRAEAALRIGEAAVFSGAAGAVNDLSLNEPVNKWNSVKWNQSGTIVNDLGELVSRPRNFIERIILPVGKVAGSERSGIDVGSLNVIPEPEFFRVSSWSTGGTLAAEAVLQSTMKTLN